MRKAMFAAAFCAASGITAFAADPGTTRDKGMDVNRPLNFKVHFIEKTATPPTIDGKLDEACWQAATPLADFAHASPVPPVALKLAPTEMRYLWDDKYLYIAVKCWEDTPENMAAYRRRVALKALAIHDRDVLELHIDGKNDEWTKHTMWLSGCGEKAGIWDYDFGWGLLTDSGWAAGADWTEAVGEGKDATGEFWCVEVRIALADLEIKPQVGYIFGMEPTRFRFEKKWFATDGTPADALPGGVNGGCAGLQIYAWGTQGVWHQTKERFGKCILVEKNPTDLVAGLRLAYPDLDKRTVRIRSTDGFLAVKGGKITNESYAGKCESLLKDARTALKRLDPIVGISDAQLAPAKAVVAGAKKFVEKTLVDVAAAEKEVVGKSVTSVVLDRTEKQTAAWIAAVDRTYCESLCKLLLAERKVRFPIKLNAGEKEPDLKAIPKDGPKMSEWEDPTLVKWAIPSFAGRKRVLACCYDGDLFAAQHLMNRVDVDLDIVTMNRGNGLNEPGLLEAALARGDRYDGIIALGCSPGRWPAKLLCRLAELQLKGVPVAMVNGQGWGEDFKPDNDFRLGAPSYFDKLVSDHPLCRTGRPESVATGPSPYALHWGRGQLFVPTVGSFGPGRVVSVGAEAPECTTLPIHPKFGPSFSTTPDRAFQDEYCLAYSCRVIMDALGMRGPAKAKRVELCPARVRTPFSGVLTVVAEKPFAGSAAVTVRDNWGKVVEAQDVAVSVPAGETTVPFRCKGLEPGEYWVDAIVMKDGRKCDFAAERLTVGPGAYEPAIACVKPTKECFEKTEDPTAEVKVAHPAPGLLVEASVRDPRYRVLARGEFPVDPETGVAKLAFPASRFRLNNHFIDVTLKAKKGGALAKANCCFWRRIGDLDDMRIFDGTSNAGGKDVEPRLALFGWHGLDLLQGGSRTRLYYGTDPAVRNRIPGKFSNWHGPISSPVWKKWLADTYAKQARDLKTRNGRFVSLGDDSGCPTDFVRGTQDWIAFYFNRLTARLKADIAAGRGGNAGQILRAWADAHGLDWVKTGSDAYWGLIKDIERGSGLERFIKTAVFDADDVTDLVAACREAYADIHILNLSNGVELKDFSEINEKTIRAFRPVERVEFPYFIVWLEKRYGTVAKLNAAWNAELKAFKDVDEVTIDSLKRLGHYTAEIDKLNFLEETFLENCRIIGEAVHGVDPTIRVGFGASNLGNCWFDVFKYLDSAVPYWGRESTDLIRCTKHGYVGETMGLYGTSYGSDAQKVPQSVREKEAWHALLSGMNFIWMWTTNPGVTGARTVNPNSFGYAFACCREMLRGPAALLLRSTYETDGIKMLYSRDCAHMGAVKTKPTTHGAARGAWCTAINELGLQYAHVTDDDIAEGALADAKVLVLPMTDVISPATAGRIGAFLAQGGTVFADFHPGLYGPDGKKLAKGTLDDLIARYPKTFRVFDRGMGFFTSKIGRREADAPRAELLKDFASAGVRPTIRVVDAEGRDVPGVEITRFTRGASYAFSIEKRTFAGETFPMKAFVELPAEGEVFDVRAGQPVAAGAKRFEIALQGMDERVFSVQPYPVKNLTVKLNPPVRGGTLEIEAKLEGVYASDTRVFRVEFVPPEGFPMTKFPPIRRYVEDAPAGVLHLSVPLAFNERGDLTVEVTDVASGLTTRVPLKF